MFHLYTLCACVCACVYVCVACLPVPYVLAHPNHCTVTCCTCTCTCMTSDSSQTGLTKTAPRSPGCSDWKPQNTSGTMRKIAPAFFSEVHVGHCLPRHYKRGRGDTYPSIDTPIYLSPMCLSPSLNTCLLI